MDKISVARGLVKLKTLQKQIDEMDSFECVAMIQGKHDNSIGDIKKFEERVKSTYQKYTDLISFRDKLKSAIVASNAGTMLTVSGKLMSVAEAIERKASISNRKKLLHSLRVSARQGMQLYESAMDKYRESLAKETEARVEAIRELFEPSLIDPLDVKAKIAELEDDIRQFEEEVDFALSESNIATMIEI